MRGKLNTDEKKNVKHSMLIINLSYYESNVGKVQIQLLKKYVVTKLHKNKDFHIH